MINIIFDIANKRHVFHMSITISLAT